MKDKKTEMRAVMQKCVWSLSTLAAVIGIAIATLSISPATAQGTQNLQFGVFIDANPNYFSGPPGPNPGTTFIVTGYIYPGGTLAGNPQVAPPNPIGEWTCRGTFTRNASEQRPEVFTIQEFYLPDDTTAIATEGIEHGLVGMDHRDMPGTIGGNGISHRHRGACRCSHGMEQRRTRRDPRRPYAATDCLPQSCYSSRLNLRRGERH